jgi:Flp pilus assembly protein TadG
MKAQRHIEMRRERAGQRGTITLEFAVMASFFFMMLVAVVAGSHLFFTVNALDEATRRGARYAALQTSGTATDTAVKNMVIYGTATPDENSRSLIRGLTADNIVIERANFGVGIGSVTVRIQSYTYNFVIPLVSKTVTMPEFRSTITGESAGYVPADIGG